MNKKGVRESMGKKDTFARFPRSYSGQRVEGIAHQQVQKKMKKENWSFPLLLFPPTSSETGNTNSKLGGGLLEIGDVWEKRKWFYQELLFLFSFMDLLKSYISRTINFIRREGREEIPLELGKESKISQRGGGSHCKCAFR